MANITLQALNRQREHRPVQVNKKPDICPVCGQGIDAVPFQDVGHLFSTDKATFYSLPFRCPREDCDVLFVATYATDRPITMTEHLTFNLKECVPKAYQHATFPMEVQNISHLFVTIYNQAGQAESDGLDHICGPGYRKALEFLIKDYLIHHKRADESIIKKKFLGNCIEEDIQDANIKTCAKRAAWLGNDETHYLRVWEKQDITDLKNLIRLTVNWIQNEILTEQYRKAMP